MPYFGAARFLFPLVLLLAGWYIEWGPGREPGAPWGRTLLGITLAYAAFLGLIQVVNFRGEFTGGRIGRFLEDLLAPLLTTPGAFIILVGLLITGILVAFDMPLRSLLVAAAHGRPRGRVHAPGPHREARRDRRTGQPAGRPTAVRAPPRLSAAGRSARVGRRGRSPRISCRRCAGAGGRWGPRCPGPGIPSAVPSQTPTSATFAPAAERRRHRQWGRGDRPRRWPAAARPATRDPGDVADAVDSPPVREAIEWVLPPHDLLDPGEAPTPAATGIADAVHARNEEIIVRKLASFDIEARIIGRNAGPVVTQYEVQPAPHIKLSRIEALQDDLSMALAARSIRIEAPIPGKSAVGIEIPNKEFNVVALRRILEELDFAASGTRLTFALGRDVAGRAQAVDLAKMPHLLIAGATGSGKSVMVNALITSLLCNATPGGRAADPDGPQAGRARGLQRPAAPAGPGHHRARAGQGRPQVGRRRDGAPLPQVRGRHGPQPQGLQRDAGATRPTACRTS